MTKKKPKPKSNNNKKNYKGNRRLRITACRTAHWHQHAALLHRRACMCVITIFSVKGLLNFRVRLATFTVWHHRARACGGETAKACSFGRWLCESSHAAATAALSAALNLSRRRYLDADWQRELPRRAVPPYNI